nr:hypothetical protein [Tanacetum cinerariifolium]
MSTSNNSNQQTLADSGANERPPMLEKGNYILWESRFRRFLDNKLKDGKRMWNSIQNGPYQRPMILNPDNTQQQILEPLSKMTEGNKKQYIADVRKQKVHDAKYFREQMLLAMKDEAGSNLTNEENDFMLNNSYSKDTLEELTVAIMLMDQLQPLYDNAKHVNHIMQRLLVRLGYQNPEHLKKAIASQPKLYNGDSLHSANLIIDSPDSEETLEDAKKRRQNRNQVFNEENGSDESNQIVQHKPKVHDAKYFREQMLLAMKDEAGSNLTNEENDFMLNNSYSKDTLEELTVAIMLMDQLQPLYDNAKHVNHIMQRLLVR